jgi:CRP-like cAMP-binding protein
MLEPAQIIQILEGHSDQQTFAAGEVIFQQGETGDLMFGILSGTVEMQVDGKVVETLEAGDVFGEGALLHSDKLRYSTAIAKTDCKLAALTEHHFLFAIQETPMFALDVMRSYSDRLRNLKAQL